MEDEIINVPNQNEEYVNTPQNDLRQIEQIAREYESEPAKGVAHGLQKDAIQNGVGARIYSGSEPNSYKNWSFKFKMLKIEGKWALSFTDEGTTGLTGQILTVPQIDKLSAEGKLTPDQNLSRFLTRFDSGGNIGPGSFGRGKLIFQAASKTSAIVCDSLRSDDLAYIAFERKLEGTRLIQNALPLQGEVAKQFLLRVGEGKLTPLEKPGTRITILDLKEEVVDTIKNSFREDNPKVMNDFSSSFIKMIEETWWEIIHKFDVKIYVEYDGKIKQVTLMEPLKSIVSVKDNERRWRVYKQLNIPVVVQTNTYKIKELRIVLSPELLDEEMRGFWIQRKRMKIGDIKGISPHHTVHKKMCGFVILDTDLENEIEKSEGPTHYSFSFKHSAPIQIKGTMQSHLQRFQESLGIRTSSEAGMERQDMLDAMKAINESAGKLGLLSEFFMGIQTKDIEINVKSLRLPHAPSKRVNIGDEIGPIEYELVNNSKKVQQIDFFITVEQRGQNPCSKSIFHQKYVIRPNNSENVTCEPFTIDEGEFRSGEPIIIVAKVNDKNSGDKLAQASKVLWLEADEPQTEPPFSVIAYSPLFPRSKSVRVEMTEAIRNIRFKVTNNSGTDVKINVDLLARKTPSASGGYMTLKEMRTERDFLLPAMSDRIFAYDALDIVGDAFLTVSNASMNAEERKCEIHFSARLSEHQPTLEMTKGEHLGKKNIVFFIGMDPPGRSIFNNIKIENEPNDGKRSRFEGERASGYTFIINHGHPSYAFASSQNVEVKQEYIQEQMLCQAYAIAVQEKEFTGVAETFKDDFLNDDISPEEAFLKIHEMIGKALIEMK